MSRLNYKTKREREREREVLQREMGEEIGR